MSRNFQKQGTWVGWWLAAFLCAVISADAGNYYGGAPANLVWTNGNIPYAFDGSVSAAEQTVYLNGVREWELACNIHLVPHTTETNWILFKYDTTFNQDSVMAFVVPEVVTISVLSRAQACHEMGHALGLQHENQRTDATNYLTVLSNNVAPAGNLQFFVADPASITNGAYDFESVMHLGSTFSSVDPSNLFTQLALPPYVKFQPRMGNLALSKGDRATAAFLHGAGPTLTNLVTTTSDVGVGSLRAALYYAQDHPGTTIKFAIPNTDPGFSNGVCTIKITGYLPPLNVDGTIIDGSTQPLFAGKPLIIIDGTAIIPEAYGAGSVTGLLIYAANCQVKALSFQNFNWNGITIQYGYATNNTIAGCWCGPNYTGTNAAPNVYQGILITGGASNNIVGGTTAAARNVLSGNLQYGILINGSNTIGNVVEGNYIGPDATGTNALPNQVGGVLLNAQGNLVGGPSAGARNVISGHSLNFGSGLYILAATNNTVQGNYIGTDATGTNAMANALSGVYVGVGAQSNLVVGNVLSGNISEGVRLTDAGTSWNLVQGNFCGTDPTGKLAVPNQFAGVLVQFGATSNTIGGTSPAARNILSGNFTVGASVGGLGTMGNVVAGNYIGTDVTGTNALPNDFAGVYLTDSAQFNTLGGAAPGAGNVISANPSYGIYCTDPGTSSNLIQGNFIGTFPDGTNALGNGFVGIIVFGGADNNVFGLALDGTGAGNRVAFNSSVGIRLDDTNTLGNTIRGNSISDNGFGIDLAAPSYFGVTPNDVGDGDTGPNNLQNFPVITNAVSSVLSTIITGTFNSRTNRSYLLDFYSSPTADGSGFGQGKVYLGGMTVTTDGHGTNVFVFTGPGGLAGQFITAMGTDLQTGDSSEFGQAKTAVSGPAPPSFIGQPFLTKTALVTTVWLTIGQSYHVRATTNLIEPITWTALTNFTAGATNFILVDRAATNFSRRFYQVLTP